MIKDFYNQPFPVLEIDDEIYLREQRIEDKEDFLKYYSNPEVGKFILAHKPQNVNQAQQELEYCKKLFEQKRGIYWSIVDRKTDRMIGAIGLYINNFHHRAELCYDLSEEYWRRGIMTRAIERVLGYTFLFIGAHRIEAVTMPTNDASMNILKKLGFEYEGRLRNYRYFQGATHDVEMFGMNTAMYFARKSQASNTPIKETA